MKHLFVDTDIILDFLGNRQPFAIWSARIFLEAHKGHFKLYTSGNSATTAYYILCKSVSENKARSLIIGLLEYIQVIPVTDKILHLALRSDFTDFEDAVQHYCALTIDKMNCIITRNIRDYKKSQVKVFSPEQLFVS